MFLMYTIFLQSQAKYNPKHRKTLEKSARNRILLPSVPLLPRNPPQNRPVFPHRYCVTFSFRFLTSSGGLLVVRLRM